MNNDSTKTNKYKKVCCSNCKSLKVVKRGSFETKAHGKQQRFFCKKCNKKFIIRTGFYRMRNSSLKITQSLDLFYRGVSTRKVQEHLGVFYPHNASNVSIYNWIIKYSKMISKLTDNLKLKIGSEVQVDEVEYKRRLTHKKGKKGVEINWFIDSICPQTKFMVASDYYKARSQNNIKEVMRSIKDKSCGVIQVITTDGLLSYPNAIKTTFGYDKKLQRTRVFHNKVNASKDEGFNYPIERLHNNQRARTKTFRGFHGSVDSANAIMKGWAIYYNFITKHQTIKCSPYEIATDLKLEEKNKWLELINLATQKS